MKRLISIFFILVLLFSFSACSGKKKGEAEGYALIGAKIFNIPGPKGTKGQKKLTYVKRGETVYIINDEKTPKGWYKVRLTDDETKGYITAINVFVGEKRPITIIEKTKWYIRPEGYSKGELKKGKKAYIIKQKKDGWFKINIGRGKWAEGWIKEGAFERGHSELKKEDQKDKGFKISLSIGDCTVKASSWLSESAGYKYTPDLAFDNKNSTSWQEGKDGSGLGEWIEIEFPNNSNYTISVINGFSHTDKKYGDLYKMNNRIKKLKVSYGENLSQNMTIDLLDDVKSFQTLGSFQTSKLRLTIVEVYPGSKWKDTSISEIKVELGSVTTE